MDFNSIVEKPKVFDGVCSGSCNVNGQVITSRYETDGEIVPVPEKVLRAWEEKYGADNWYDWCTLRWGTKWNSYGNIHVLYEDVQQIDIKFETAWSPPIPIYEKLDEMFPQARIYAFWSDEGSYERIQVYKGEIK